MPDRRANPIQPLRGSVGEIAQRVGGRVVGDASVPVEGIGAIGDASPRQLTFAVDDKRAAQLADSQAAAALVAAPVDDAPMPLIVVDDVNAAMARLLETLGEPDDEPEPGTHPTAHVDPTAAVGEDVAIGPAAIVGPEATLGDGVILGARAFVGAHVEIGQASRLFEGVIVRAGSRIGQRVRIGPNSVIGHDGFGYYTQQGVHHRIPHAGGVVIDDDVELGACVCVDRGKFGVTRIGAGTKVDNLVQIGHNVQIGRGCILCGQVGIAGSARLGDYVVLGGNAGVRDNITLGEGVQATAFAAIAQDVSDGEAVAGVPARPVRQALRSIKALERLPELLKRFKALETRIEKLASPEDH
jgi:UDP-3-O-[3-hydroxymyristoyl] glucosamine N-acyltransferase